MMLRILLFALIGLLLTNGIAQQVYPPAKPVYSYEVIPGLTNELNKTITNAYPMGIDGGNTSGRVEKIERQLYIYYPDINAILSTNSFAGTFSISNTGITYVEFPVKVFKSIPFISVLFTNIPNEITVTPVIDEISTNGFRFRAYTAGNLLTNEITVAYLAQVGIGYGYFGDLEYTIDLLLDGTNVVKRDGSTPFTGKCVVSNIQFVGNAEGKWITGDNQGNMIWEEKRINNLQDGSSIYLRDGSRALLGNMNVNNYMLTNIARLQMRGNNGEFSVPNDLVLGSYNGDGSVRWLNLGAQNWANYVAGANVNIGERDVYNLRRMVFNTEGTNKITLYSYRHGVYGHNIDIALNGVSMVVLGQHIVKTVGDFNADNGIFSAGYIKKPNVGHPNLIDRYGGYFRRPLAVEDGILVGDATTISTYQPPINTVCAGSGFIGTKYSVILSSMADINYLVNNNYWRYLTNYYPFAVSANRAVFFNTPILLTASSNSLYNYRNYTGVGMRVEGTIECINLNVSGDLSVSGNKNFKINHPLDDSKWLYHTSIESPRAELIYRGKTILTNGVGEVNIDNYFGMTAGTFEALNKDIDVYVWNNKSWDRVRASYGSGRIIIECENSNFNDEVSFAVFGIRNGIVTRLEENK